MKRKRKKNKRINLAKHDPSERVLFARANSRSKQRILQPSCRPLFPSSSILALSERNFVLDRDSWPARSFHAILVYRVARTGNRDLACPDVRQLKQPDIHDIAQSVIRTGWLIAPRLRPQEDSNRFFLSFSPFFIRAILARFKVPFPIDHRLETASENGRNLSRVGNIFFLGFERGIFARRRARRRKCVENVGETEERNLDTDQVLSDFIEASNLHKRILTEKVSVNRVWRTIRGSDVLEINVPWSGKQACQWKWKIVDNSKWCNFVKKDPLGLVLKRQASILTEFVQRWLQCGEKLSKIDKIQSSLISYYFQC